MQVFFAREKRCKGIPKRLNDRTDSRDTEDGTC